MNSTLSTVAGHFWMVLFPRYGVLTWFFLPPFPRILGFKSGVQGWIVVVKGGEL